MYGIVVYIPISKGAERSLVLPEESVSGCNRPDRREWRGGKMKRDTLAHALTFLRTDTNTQTRTHTYITHTNTHTHTHTHALFIAPLECGCTQQTRNPKLQLAPIRRNGSVNMP